MLSHNAFVEVVANFVCPSLGCVISTLLFAAPVQGLRKAIIEGSLGEINPFPWVMLTGTCLGWVSYGYYMHDPFVVAANLPGLVLSLWLNIGAIKLQYLQKKETMNTIIGDTSSSLEEAPLYSDSNNNNNNRNSNQTDQLGDISNKDNFKKSSNGNDNNDEDFLILVPQEKSLFLIIMTWCTFLIYVGWLYHPDTTSSSVNDKYINYHPQGTIIGWCVNINLIYFYGPPLKLFRRVLVTRSSGSIHRPTVIIRCCNTLVWIIYGIYVKEMVIVFPNAIGLILGLLQGILCFLYPVTKTNINNAHDATSRVGKLAYALQLALQEDQEYEKREQQLEHTIS